MSIQRKGPGHYEARWKIGGRQRSRTVKAATDTAAHKLAVKAEEELRLQAERGAYGEAQPSSMLLEDWLVEWARNEGPHWSKSLRDTRLPRMAVWVEPYLGRERLCDIAEKELRRWHTEMTQLADRKGAGHTQVQHAWKDLSAAMGAAYRDGLLPRNPALGALPRTRRRRVAKTGPRTLTPFEVERIRSYLTDPQSRALVSVLAYCGLRPEEAAALRWADVDARHVTVSRAYTHGEEGPTKTEAGERRVKLVAPLADDLAELRRRNFEAPDQLVFQGPRGAHLNFNNWRSWSWKPAREAARVADCRPYDLRHTFASLLINEGRSAVDVARQMGHTKPSLVLDRYAHAFDDADLGTRADMVSAISEARLRAATELRDCCDGAEAA